MTVLQKITGWIVRKSGIISPNNPYLAKLMSWSYGDETELTRPYSQHPVFYAAVRAKARNIAQVPFRLYQRGSDKPFENEKHPLVQLFNDVNPQYSRYQLWEAIVTCLDIKGESFVVKDRETVNGIPVFLWPQDPDNFKEQFRGKTFVGWEFTNDGEKLFLFPEEVIQPKYYNPYSYYRGLSPLKALDTGLTADWSSIKYNKRFFDNDGTPGAVYSTDQQLTDAQYARLQHELINSRKGVDHAHRAMLMDGGLKISNTAPSSRDMQFLEGRKFSREEIAMVLGVPKPELQLYEDVNYATSRSADLSFWKKTLIPLMVLIEDKFNTDFLYALGFEGHFDTAGIDVLNEDLLQKADAATKFYNMGVPFNVINERLALGFPPITGGDDPKQPVFALPEPVKGKGIEIHGDREPKKIDGAYATKEARGEVWKSKINQILPFIGRCNKAVKNYFFDVEQKILRAYAKAPDRWVVKGDVSVEDVDAFFDDEKLRKAIQGPVDEALRIGMRNANYPGPEADAIISRRMNSINGINDTSRKALKENLRKTLLQAMNEGWTEDKRAQAVMETIKDTMDASKNRAKTIARTEVHGAFSEGLWEGSKIAKPKQVMWITSRDARVRDSHADLDGVKVAFGDTFPNGLQYPMDPTGDEEEVINCRCTYIDIFDD